MINSIRVLVVDDHLVVREGIRALLATEADLVVVGDACDGAEAVAQAARLRPDVILMDLMMPQMDGIAATQHIIAGQPTARILILTGFAADDALFPAIRAGAHGYVLKNSGAADLVRAIRRVHQNERASCVAVAADALHPALSSSPCATLPEALTEREVEVLRLVAQGDSNQRIAAALGLSTATVRTHVSNILSKLHLHSRTQAALYALRQGWASLADEAVDSSDHDEPRKHMVA